MMIIRNVNKIAICYSLLFLVDLVAIFNDYVPVSILKVLLYIFCFSLLYSVLRHSKKTICYENKSFWHLTMIYFIMLFIRLCVDFVLPWKGFFLYLNPLTIVFFYFMTMVIPSYFIRRVNGELDYMRFSLISGICLCIYLFYSYSQIVSGKIDTVTPGGQYAGFGGIDIITYGHLGLSLVLIAVYILMYSNMKIKVLSLLFLFIGISTMIFSGTRSSFLGLVICLIILLRSKYSKWYFSIIGLVIVMASFKYFSAEIIQLNEHLNSVGIGSFGRVVNTFIYGNTSLDETLSGRDDIWKIGLNLFSQNPIFGTSYLLPDYSYVHNIFLEQFMALGIIGGSIFVIINLKAIFLGWKAIANSPKTVLIYALFIQYLILGIFSRTIIALGAYWLFMFITIKNYERVKE